MWVMNAFAHTYVYNIVRAFPNARARARTMLGPSLLATRPLPASVARPRPTPRPALQSPSSSLSLSPFPFPFPSPPPSSHLSKVLSISHHSVHTADVDDDDSDTADDCEVRTLAKEKRPQAGRQTGPTDNNREVYVSVRLATVPTDKRATSSRAHKCHALTERALHPD